MSGPEADWQWADQVDSSKETLADTENDGQTYLSVEELIRNNPEVIIQIIFNSYSE